MNAFMILVERAVRPVQAGPKRKLRMREELLAHLTSIYDEEVARLGDEAAARAEAARRFGDPAALTSDLQATVTFPERLDFRLNRLVGWQPGEGSMKSSARLAVLVSLLILPWFPLALVASAARRPDDPTIPSTAMFVQLFAGVLVFVPAAVFAMSVITTRIRDSLYGTPRSWGRAVGFASLSLVVFPMLGTAFALVAMPDAEVMFQEMTKPRSILGAVAGYALMPVYLIGIAWRFGPGQLRQLEWENLDIGS